MIDSSLSSWNAQRLDRYAAAHGRGDHDAQCEQQERSSLCHCRKRRRLAAGITEPAVIWHRSPQCGTCLGDLGNDGDGWVCSKCSTSWPNDASDGDAGAFDDDYGDGLGGERWGRRLVDLLREDGAL